MKWISSKHIDGRGNITAHELISRKAVEETSTRVAPKGSTIIITRVSIGKYAFADDDYAINQDLTALVSKDRTRLDSDFIRVVALHIATVVERNAEGIGVRGVTRNFLSKLQIPLPPLEVQQEIVAEIESYQKIIDGARAVIDNYSPHIPIDPAWPMVSIANVAANQPHSLKAGPFGSALKKEFYVPFGYKIYGQEQVIRGDPRFGDYYISKEKHLELESCKVQADDVLISLVGTYGKTLIVPDDYEPGIINPRLLKITLDKEKMIPEFFVTTFAQESVISQVRAMSYGGTMNILSMKVLKSLRLPLPSLGTQKQIVTELKAEQALVEANHQLIDRFERKIQATIARIWGESEPDTVEA